ncbi:MAG: hypothetical protein IJG38_14275, partial [Thermoguttaceae bacterium]|nr:hypothetical protein [Thermoguttaceae bacterium]
GQWIQLTGVYDGDTWRLYKNCVEVASTSSSVGAVPVNANWTIGSSANGTDRFFNGKIGACGIYDHALDAQSVATLMSDNQTTARVGGNPYAIKDQSYVLQLEASHPDVLWTVNWGDGTTDEYYNVSSASHVYTHYGTSGVSVTAKRNGQTIDVAGSSISLQIGSVDEMIINGNFEDVAIPNGTYWAVYNSISGWTGPVEIQVNNGSKVAELDTDSRYSGLDPSVSDHQPHHTSISSSPLSFTPGLTYTLSFDAWNRSDYAQDNILNVTVPGEIISVNGNTPVSTLLDLIDEDDLGAYSYTSISYNSLTFSAGGSYYETDDGNGGTVYTLGASPFHVSSITFIAANDYGTVSFSDVSSDVVPCYGPLLDNISMNQEYLYVDIDVDSNNDGVINAFDDPVEMAPNGGKILAVGYGQCKPINLSVHTNQTNLASDNIVYQLEYDNSKILLYNTAELPQAVYGTEIDISPYYIAPNTDLPNGFLTLDGSIKTIYVDGFVLEETTVMLKAYSVYSNSSGNTVRELISSDVIKLNIGFDLDTDSNENGTIDYAYNFALSTGKLSVRPHVEDMVEDLAGYGCTLVTGSSTNVKISKREIEIPEGCQLQLIISAGLTGYTYWENGQLPGLHNPSSLIDDTLGEVYTVSSDFPDNFCVQCGDLDNNAPVERTIHLRLVRTSDNAILARDTIRFNCVPYELDLRVDINDNGFTEIDDNLNEDDDDYTGFLIPYGDHYNENVTQEQIHNIDDAHIFVFLPPNANKTEWDNKYIRLCQVNSDREIVQVLGVYQLGDTNVFFWNANSSCYQITDLTFIAEESSKNSYEAWVRAELYDTLPADNTIQTGNKTLKIHDLNSSPALNLSTDSMLASDLIKMTATLFVMDRKTTYVVNSNKYAGRTSSSDIDNDHVIDQVQDQKFKWICNLKDGTYETPKTGGQIIDYTNPEAAVPVNNNNNNDLITGVTYLRSALRYDNTGFVMNLDYSFVAYPGKDNSIDQYGYVQAQNKDKPDDKLSFVSNGGIKFGNVGGYSDGVYEIAILDVKNMIHKFFNKTDISDSDFSDLAQIMINSSNNTTISYNNVSYTWEKYSKLLNGIGYGQLNINGSNYQNSINNLTKYLKDTYNLLGASNNMIITTESCSTRYSSVSVVTNDKETFTASSHDWENEDTSYHTDYISAGNGYLYLQSHWGSGVIYTINSLIPNNNNGGNNGNN